MKSVSFVIALVVCCSLAPSIRAQDKWVWRRNDRDKNKGERDRTGKVGASERYEVVENDYDDDDDYNRPNDFLLPERPLGGGPGPGPGVPPPPFGINRPPLGGGGPGDFPGPHDPDLSGGVLTGPVPSWDREPPFKHFDACKCAAKFNCNSPGISYGQCDVGKQYCCYNRRGHSYGGGPVPSRPLNSPENGVLVGPGGPARPQDFYYDRPGGGAAFRPPSYGESGVLTGPGQRPPPPGAFPYARRKKDDEK